MLSGFRTFDIGVDLAASSIPLVMAAEELGLMTRMRILAGCERGTVMMTLI